MVAYTYHKKQIILIFTIVFIASILFFGEFNSASDGFTRFGFPLVFMQYTGGKCIDCKSTNWFNVCYLLGDVFLGLLFSAIILRIWYYFKKHVAV